MSEKLAVAVVDSGPVDVARHGAGMDFEAMMRLAVEQKDGGVLERMMAIRRELNAEAAKAAFDTAMRDFQAECPPVSKIKGVPDRGGNVAYRYAPFEHILAVVKPTLQKHGFSFTLDTDTESQQGWVIAKCLVTHCAGHSVESRAKFPLGTKTGIMSDTQVYASALTFASRRVFCNAFGIVTAGEDTDGRTQTQKPAGPSALAAETDVKPLAQEVWNLLKKVRGPKPDWTQANDFLWREDFLDAGAQEAAPNLSAARFTKLIAALKAKPEVLQ